MTMGAPQKEKGKKKVHFFLKEIIDKSFSKVLYVVYKTIL